MAARSEAYVLCACALVALTQLPGCADDGVSMHVICAIEPELEDGVCTYEAAGDACVLEGVMNLAATRNYRQSLRIESGLVARAREVPPRSESNRIQLNGAKVELRDTAGNRLNLEGPPNPYDVTVAGFIAPGEIGAANVTLISPVVAAALARAVPTQIVVAVTLRGETDGKTAVDSGEFLWPLRLINTSVDPAANDCQAIETCANSYGQDSFATACKP